MKTTRLTFNHYETAAILPGLEAIVNGIANAREDRYLRRDPVYYSTFGGTVYSQQRFDEEMAARVLSCRNKLKSTNSSRKVHLDVFELSAAALAFRVVRREKLAPEDVITRAKSSDLGNKLERYRKRAKRSAISGVGDTSYREQVDRWRRFAAWARFNLLTYRPRKRSQKYLSLLYKEQREAMRALAMDVAVKTADQARIHYLADLARREVRRGRHGTKLGSLLSDHDKVRQFLAQFILRREGAEVLRPEFQPACLRTSTRSEKLEAALTVDKSTGAPPKGVAPAARAQSAISGILSVTREEAAADGASVTPTPAQERLAVPNLSHCAAEWLIDEVEPGYRKDVADEIKKQVFYYWRDQYDSSTISDDAVEAIAECRPDYNASSGPEITAFFAEWGARWLLALNPNPFAVCSAVENGLCLAEERWEKMDPLTQQDKLNEIYRRYFQ